MVLAEHTKSLRIRQRKSLKAELFDRTATSHSDAPVCPPRPCRKALTVIYFLLEC